MGTEGREHNTVSKLQIRGILVSSAFDNEWWASELESGLITPLSRVETALAEAATDEPLQVYINSPGGSVFSGHEMKNALVSWRNATGQAVEITVGAMAASAAATIAVMLGPVKAYANTLFMFHSAQTEQYGGAGAMTDAADLIDKINEQVMSVLVSRYGIDATTVSQWFAEGRMGWMTADEAKEAGMVSEIIADRAEVIAFDATQLSALQGRGLDAAAMLDATTDEYKTERDNMDILEQLTELLHLEDATPESALEAVTALQAATAAKAEAAYDEGLAAGKAESRKAELETATAELAEKVTTAEAALATAQAEVETARTEATAKADALAKAEARLAAIDKGFRATGTDSTAANGTTGSFFDVVQALVTDGASKEQALLTVQREHPDLHAAMIAAANKIEGK